MYNIYIYIYVEQKVSPKHASATLLSLADERCLAFTGRPKGPDIDGKCHGHDPCYTSRFVQVTNGSSAGTKSHGKLTRPPWGMVTMYNTASSLHLANEGGIIRWSLRFPANDLKVHSQVDGW